MGGEFTEVTSFPEVVSLWGDGWVAASSLRWAAGKAGGGGVSH